MLETRWNRPGHLGVYGNEAMASAYRRFNYTDVKYTKKQWIACPIGLQVLELNQFKNGVESLRGDKKWSQTTSIAMRGAPPDGSAQGGTPALANISTVNLISNPGTLAFVNDQLLQLL